MGRPLEIDAVYLEVLKREFPGLRTVNKASDRFSHVIHTALVVLTMGGQKAYLTRYVTTIGATLYFPSDWAKRTPQSRYITLRHEAVHLRQFRRFGLIGTSLIYLLPLFPVCLAIGRAWLEWEAYAETFRAIAEVHGLEAARESALRERVKKQFVGPAYGWMFPFPRTVDRWIDALLTKLALEYEASGH